MLIGLFWFLGCVPNDLSKIGDKEGFSEMFWQGGILKRQPEESWD